MESSRERVVLVHGIWMTGLEMHLLRSRLHACGYDVRGFRYASLVRSPRENACALADFIRSLGEEPLHLVAHSLGGIVLMHLFDQFQDLPPGRVVLLGSPLAGSGVARRISAIPLLRHSLGRSVQQGLLGGVPGWRGERELGAIAGVGGFGVGSLVGGLEGAGDGTVAAVETRLENAADYCELRTSHTGMLFSAEVAKAVCHFLQQGSFTKNLH